MTEPREPSQERATGESGVAGSRRDAAVPSGSSVPDVIDVADGSTYRGGEKDPTTSSLSEMVVDPGRSVPPTEVEPVTDSGYTDPYSPTGTANPAHSS